MRQLTPTIAVSAAFSFICLICFFSFAGPSSNSSTYASLRSGAKNIFSGPRKDYGSSMENPFGVHLPEIDRSFHSPSQEGLNEDGNIDINDNDINGNTNNEDDNVLTGVAVMPKLGNETAKEELGRASWKLFHTLLCRFPKNPSSSDREKLKNFITLFATLYPW